MYKHSLVNRPSVLLISIDGVRPDLVFQEENYKINLPNLKNILLKMVLMQVMGLWEFSPP